MNNVIEGNLIVGMNNQRKIILASASPRRREILNKYNIQFEIEVSDVDESHTQMNPQDLVKELSFRKAKAVAEKHPNDYVIGADTVVSIDGDILEKPKGDEDAFNMIDRIQGRCHQVYTGVTIISPTDMITFAEKTDVFVKPMTPEEIRSYIATGEGRDKAGSYAIQGMFGRYIDRYDGDFENVVGLPGKRVVRTLYMMRKI